MSFVKSLFLLSILGLTSLSGALAQPSARIINGVKATGDYDFFVSVMRKYEWQTGYHWNPVCGGSFIGDNTVVTAAHCVIDILGEEISLVIGDSSTDMQSEYCSQNSTQSAFNCTTRSSNDVCVEDYYYTGWIAYTGDESNLITLTLNSTNVSIHKNYSKLKNINCFLYTNLSMVIKIF